MPSATCGLRQPSGQVERVGRHHAVHHLVHAIAQPVVGEAGGQGQPLRHGDQPVSGIVGVGQHAVGQQVAVGVPGIGLGVHGDQPVGVVITVSGGDRRARRRADRPMVMEVALASAAPAE